MLRLMSDNGVAPNLVAYVTGELFVDGEDFRRALNELAGRRDGPVRYIFVDEITYVRDWDRAVKFLADAGVLENVYLLLTGSDLILIQDALKRLPGRRGPAARVDFHYYPLNFLEFCSLRARLRADDLDSLSSGFPEGKLPDVPRAVLEALEEEFRQYHRTGGYLSAINDLEQHGHLAEATLRVYSDWIRGDVIRQGRDETYLREVLGAILSRYTTQVTWNALAKDLPIDHPKTIADYCALLERMDAVFVLPALREDRLAAAPKKARKIYFTDPFIYHAVRVYLESGFTGEAKAKMAPIRSEVELSKLVEASIVTHLRRAVQTFYIKAEGEVDVAYIRGNRFWPIEIKWTEQIRPRDLKQVLKYPNAVIAGSVREAHEISGIPVLPAPVVSLRLSRLSPGRS
jgi:predicted AAA+ superfamily ATPase